jgi:hypothetical protein
MIVDNRSRLLYYFAALSEMSAVLRRERVVLDDYVPRSRVLRRAPRVVWLTDLADPQLEHDSGAAVLRPGLNAPTDYLARIMVSVSDAQHWPQWASRHGVSKRSVATLDDEAGGLSGRWWVVSRIIPATEWVRVDSLRTGARIWPESAPEDGLPRPAELERSSSRPA